MNRSTKYLAIITTLILSLLGVSTALAQDVTQVVFKPGASADIVAGTVANNSEGIVYQFQASRGQTILAEISAVGSAADVDAEFNFIDGDAITPGLKSHEFAVQADGQYRIGVGYSGDAEDGSAEFTLALAIISDGVCAKYITEEADLDIDALAGRLGVTKQDIVDANPQFSAGGTLYGPGEFLVYPCPDDDNGDGSDGDGDGDGNTGGPTTHLVQPGENLFRIALRYGVSVSYLQDVNNLGSSTLIYAGQTLTIFGSGCTPGSGTGTCVPGTGTPGTGGPTSYVVQPGDTLFSIARRFGTTVSALQQANGLGSSTTIYSGTTLTIPGAGASGTHVVQAGETLFSIAVRYGTTVQTLQSLNGISNPNFVYAGQVLNLP